MKTKNTGRTRTMSKSNVGEIDRTSGCEGFLNPPTHPEHTMSVRLESEDHFIIMSLSSAAGSDWLDAATRKAARDILAGWERPPIDRDDVRAWVAQVLGYFRSCYRGGGPEETAWHVANLSVKQGVNPMEHIDNHAGVHFIRKYYPEFTPTREDFDRARWGQC